MVFLKIILGIIIVALVVGVIAGIEGIICGCSAIYTAVAGIIDGEFHRPVMPV